MYCKKCGEQIDEDSEFCKKCGAKQNTVNVNNNNEKKGCGIAIIVIIAFISSLIVFFSIDARTKNNNNDKGDNVIEQMFTRDANNGDIEIDSKMNLNNLGVDIIIHPNCDIENLSIKIIQYDNDGKIVKTINKNLGNVKEGVELSTSLSLTDFSITEIWSLGATEIKVVGGKVKK